MTYDRTHPTGIDQGPDSAARSVKLAATVVGGTFLLVGVLGFVPGITTDVGDMTFAGHESGSELLGIFHVSVLHNIVHLLFGVAGLAMARTARGATSYLIGGGVIYLVLAIYGAVVDQDSSANFVPLDTADNWLHLALAAGMVGLGMIGLRARPGTVGANRPG